MCLHNINEIALSIYKKKKKKHLEKENYQKYIRLNKRYYYHQYYELLLVKERGLSFY